jgi:hypothetical protein
MTIRHLNNRHYDWKHIIDYETFWILTFSAVVLGSGILALFCRTPPTLSRDKELLGADVEFLRPPQSPAIARVDGMPHLELIFLHSESADGYNARHVPLLPPLAPV